jgi:hypothetical protein
VFVGKVRSRLTRYIWNFSVIFYGIERTIWIADAHRADGKRFVVRADEKLTAFLELESAILELNKRQHS